MPKRKKSFFHELQKKRLREQENDPSNIIDIKVKEKWNKIAGVTDLIKILIDKLEQLIRENEQLKSEIERLQSKIK